MGDNIKKKHVNGFEFYWVKPEFGEKGQRGYWTCVDMPSLQIYPPDGRFTKKWTLCQDSPDNVVDRDLSEDTTFLVAATLAFNEAEISDADWGNDD